MTPAELLDFERTWPRHTSHKEAAIFDHLRVRPARYYALLHRAAASHEGLAHDPFTAHAVLRRRAHTLPTKGHADTGIHPPLTNASAP